MLVWDWELESIWRVYSLGQIANKKKLKGKDDLNNSSERTSFQILVGRAIYP